MLYKKNNTETLDKELFKNPTSEYRGTPFWAFNCKLDREDLEWQLENFKKMGFGGAHMHVRTGLDTPYLSDEFMDIIKACVNKAKSEDMLAWLYDEDRFASGTGGGFVTEDERYRSRYLLFTPTPYSTDEEKPDVDGSYSGRILRNERGIFLCSYDVELDESGNLISYKVIDENQPAEHEKWYAYEETQCTSPWYNGQAYVNTLDKKAIEKFIELVHERYADVVGEEFGKTVPAIFTDEPHFAFAKNLMSATEEADVVLPWTDDLTETYALAYNGEKLLENIPELIWDRADGTPSRIRYHYYDHISERFAEAYADTYGKWCEEHGIALVGHLMEEGALGSQSMAVGESMRSYRSFTIPGIDMLFAAREYTTAKQAESAVHQYGKEGMISELYGVTNWDFDFRGHKLHGDWQAAMGATVRAHHLAWVSMKGEAKRDYPASINYQSPWWEKYYLIEDHFARLNTALTRGKPIVKVGVIHPIETYWLHRGPEAQTKLVRNNLERNFRDITQWLSFGQINFDFISEALLPTLSGEASFPLKVGEMEYDVIVVPGCETLRSTTLDRLEKFAKDGGKVVFAHDVPRFVDAVPSERGLSLASKSECVNFNQSELLRVLESARQIEIRDKTGKLTDNLLYNMRADGCGRWLFIAHGTDPSDVDASDYRDLTVSVDGEWNVTVYNTMTGETEAVCHENNNGKTKIFIRMYDYDSQLLWLEPSDGITVSFKRNTECVGTKAKSIELPSTVSYTLDEPNVLLLDQAEYAIDGGDWEPKEEILRIDRKCREVLGIKKTALQPWLIPDEPFVHTLHLRFLINSEIVCSGAKLAIEDAECVTIRFNGKEVERKITGWYVDKAIKTVELPEICIGENVLEVDIPFGRKMSTEWAYLLGDFGVTVDGRNTCITTLQEEISFGNITTQGLPFYGGNITYHIPIITDGGKITVCSDKYRGVLQTVSVDGGEEQPLMYAPYTAELENLASGEHTVHFKLYGHRRNSFGTVHLNEIRRGAGPGSWYIYDDRWTYGYTLVEEGILNAPTVTENKKSYT